MAGFTRSNGDLRPVAVMDAGVTSGGAGFNNGADTVTDGATVQPQGPALAFFTYSAPGELNAAGAVKAMKTIAQLATVHIYKVDITNAAMAVAIYPVGAWTTATLKTALDAATGYTSASTSVDAEAMF